MKPKITILSTLLSALVLGIFMTAPLLAQPTELYDIYIFNPKTGVTQQVTSIPDAGEYNPAFSNNGKKIVHDVKVEVPPSHALYITKINTGVGTPLAGADGGNDAAWSRNGRLIAFDRVPVGDSTLYVIPASGGTIPVRANAIDPHWSPNSKNLVFTDVTGNAVRTINLKTGTENIVAPLGINPAWSRNGDYIAFSDVNDLFIVMVDGLGAPVGSPVQLTFDGAGVYNQQPSWSRDDSMLVFHSNRGGPDFDLWTVPAGGGPPALLTGLGGAGDFDPACSGGGPGRLVAYAAIGPPLLAPTVAGTPSKKALKVTSYPNPFNPSTTFTVSLSADANATVRVYDLLGKEVATLADGPLSSGTHSFTWNAENLPSGTYLYRVEAGEYRIARLISLIK